MPIPGEGNEQVVDPKDQRPSNPQDAYERFLKVRAEKEKAAAAARPDPSEEKKGQEAEPKKEVSKNPWEGFRIVDKDGNPAKLPLSVDGEKVDTDDLNKIGTWAQFGFHHDKKGKELKVKEEEITKKVQKFELEAENFKKGMPLIQKLQQAIEEGKLKIAEDGTISRPSGKEVDDDHIKLEEEDDEYGPQYIDLAKRFNKMIDMNKKLERDLNSLKQLQLAQLFKEEKMNIDNEISRLKPTYPLATEKEIIDLLAEIDQNDRPKYTVEEAMKKSQEEVKKRFEAYVKSDPDFMNKTEEQKQGIIKEYLDKVNERNKAPVSGPQGTGAAGADIRKKEHEEGGKALTPEQLRQKAADHFSNATKFLNEKIAQSRRS